MAKIKMYIDFNISEAAGYISIKKMIKENEIELRYNDYVAFTKKYGVAKLTESFEGYKLRFLHLDVTFDGRKNRITTNNVMDTLVKKGYATDSNVDNMYRYIHPTSKLIECMEDQKQLRIDFAMREQREEALVS